MPDANGYPMAGEWWEMRGGGKAYVAGALQAVLPISSSPDSQLTGWKNEDGQITSSSWSHEGKWISECESDRDLVKHLPDCTGWDWQAPDWVELDPVNYGWHVIRIEVDECRHVNDEMWGSVGFLDGKLLSENKGNFEFRCLRKDLPVKPPEPARIDPGEGWRLVTDYSAEPTPDVQRWCNYLKEWQPRPFPSELYSRARYYRVPIDPAPVPPIPLSEDPCPWFNEPWSDIPPCESNPAAVVAWIVGALVFLTGFLIGWSL